VTTNRTERDPGEALPAYLPLVRESAARLLGVDGLDEALNGLFEKLVPEMGLDACFELVPDSGGGLMLAACALRAGTDDAALREADLGAGLAGVAARSGRRVIAHNLQDTAGDDAAVERGLGFRAYACYPLQGSGRLLGVLAFASRAKDTLAADQLAVLETISRHAAAARERLMLIGELRAVEARQDAFLATLAHELRNPLAPIRNALEIMRVNAREQSAVANAARTMIERQLEQLVRLVDDAQRTGLGRVAEPQTRLRATMPRTPPPGSGSEAHATARRVLVADDNRDSAESLGMLLRLMGNDVRIVYDGMAAVSEAEAFRPDVILLDIGMPNLDGYEAARRIREQPWSEGALLVALTGWGNAEDKRRASEAGFDRHFTKPIHPSELRRLLTDP
jgi:CheY-like chemotaxis protein